MEAASKTGMRVQAVLCFAWPKGVKEPFPLSPVSRLPAEASGQGDMERFIQEAVSRYADVADAWGVEDNLSAEAFPGGPDVYAEMLRAVSSVVRSKDPQSRIVFGPIQFDSMESDQRMFYVSDVAGRLGGGQRVFDAIELRLIGRNASDDYRRIIAAVDFMRGQLDGTPYASTSIALLSSSPASSDSGGGEDEQAADLVRRVLLAASRGVAKMSWGPGLEPDAHPGADWAGFTTLLGRSGLVGRGGGAPRMRKAGQTAQILRRLEARGALRTTRIEQVSKGLYMAEIEASQGHEIVIVWRDYFVAGESYGSSTSLPLMTFDIEGPARMGLYALELVPDGNGSFPLRPIPDKYFDLGGSPTILSQDLAWLCEISLRPYTPPPPTPVYTPAPIVYATPSPTPLTIKMR